MIRARKSHRKYEGDGSLGENDMDSAEPGTLAHHCHPRQLVEAELQMHGIRIVSPRVTQETSQSQQSMEWVKVVDGDECFEMTEEELIELMEEIERDCRQEEEKFLENEINRIQGEEQALIDSIEDYEQWNESALSNDSATDSVLCPLCQECNLVSSNACEMGYDIVCPNSMDDSCAFALPARPGLLLSNLKDRLAETIRSHAMQCSQQITFEVLNEDPSVDTATAQLWAICYSCDTRLCLI